MLLADRGRALRALLALPLLALPVSLHASGFAVESQGARAAGLSASAVAQSVDASVIAFNPAGIAFLKGGQLYLSGTFDSISTDFTGEGPVPPKDTLESSNDGLGIVPAAYASLPLGRRAAVGVGFGLPFGFRSRWNDPDTFSGRFLSLDARVRSSAISPTIAYKLADRLAVGFGLDVRLSTFEQIRRLEAKPNPFPVPTEVAELRLVSNASAGLGWSVGVQGSPSDAVSFGVAYRHKVVITHDTPAGFVQILTGNKDVDDAVAKGLPQDQLAVASFTYPASLSGGVAVRRGDLTVEGDVVFTLWSSFTAVYVRFPEASSYDWVQPQNFEDAWRASIGAEYLIRDAWEVRGGYSYDRATQPVGTLSPLLHEGSRHGLSLGGSYKYENLRLDAVARVSLSGSRSTGGLSGYAYEGAYRSKSFGLGVSLGYRF